MSEKAEQNLEFKAWLAEIDQAIVATCSLGYLDLPDVDYWAMFEFGDTPQQAAETALEEAGFGAFMGE